MKAVKFLLPDRVAPFTGFRWPVGEWVESSGDVACTAGIHACDAKHLSFWLRDELWEMELGQEVAQGRHKLVARSGRLVRRLEAWDAQAGEEFSAACVERVRKLARKSSTMR